jgi:hypothetical protein
MSVLTKLEIDVLVAGELDEAAQLAAKYHLPALVIHPGLAVEGHIARGRIRGQYKIITPIDWPKGEIFGSSKMRGLSTDALEAEGFEILLTPGKSEVDTRNEAKVITEFIRNHLGPLPEIRFVMGTLTRPTEEIKIQSLGLKGVPLPAFVRNDISLKSQVSKANPDVHNANIDIMTESTKFPVKISGNINDLKAIASCKNADKFGVSLLQAKQIIKEFNSHPQKLKELLGDAEDTVPNLQE